MMKTPYIIILVLTLLSFKLVDYTTLDKNNINFRNSRQIPLAKGYDGYSLEYGMLTPAIIYAVQKVLNIPFNIYKSQLIASNAVNFLLFLLIYFSFFRYLKYYFRDSVSMVGLMLLASVVTLSINGSYPESDFLNLLFFLAGFHLMLKGRDIFLPGLILIGMFNEMQISFLVVFYICFLAARGKRLSIRNILILLLSSLVCVTTYMAIDSNIGIYDINTDLNISNNLKNPGLLLQMWLVSIALIVVSIFGFRSSQKFFRYALAAVFIFIVLIFILGNFYDSGKFLPAYLILLPMSLNFIFGDIRSDAGQHII